MKRLTFISLLVLLWSSQLLARNSSFLFLEFPTKEGVLGLPSLYEGRYAQGRLIPAALYRLSHHDLDIKVLLTKGREMWLHDGRRQLICLSTWSPNVECVISDVGPLLDHHKDGVLYVTPMERNKEREIRFFDYDKKEYCLHGTLPRSYDYSFSLSPDKKRLLFVRTGKEREVIMRNIKSGAETVIVSLPKLLLLPKIANEALWLTDSKIVVVAKNGATFPYSLQTWSTDGKLMSKATVPLKRLCRTVVLNKDESGTYLMACNRHYRFGNTLRKVKEEKLFDHILLRERPNWYRVKRVGRPLEVPRVAWLSPKRRPVNSLGEQKVVSSQTSPDKRYVLLGLTDMGQGNVARRCALLDRKTNHLLSVQMGKGPARPVCWFNKGQ